jgi:hypothetical protein
MPSASGGYLHLVPFYLPQGMTFTGMSMSALPWMSPSYSGVVGTTTSNPSEAALTITFEWPIPWLRTVTPIEKIDREILYVRRFSADQALVTGTHAFSNVRPGPDPNLPPDTMVTTDQGVLGVESTSLTVEKRRGAYKLFQLLRRRILEQDPAAFANLAGHVIYVWFEDPKQPGIALPFRKNDDAAVTELLQELAGYKPKTDQMWIPGGALPQQAPALPLASTQQGARFYAMPLASSAPSTMLFSFTGFEVGFAYTSIITATDAWQELQRLVDDHDQPGVDILLITSGGPDQSGLVFPAEEALAHFILDNPLGLPRAPKNIQHVWLHSWTTGHAVELHPNLTSMFGPLYHSLMVEHFPLVPQQQPVAAGPADAAAQAAGPAEIMKQPGRGVTRQGSSTRR